jgi:uncharacterized membrane protein YdbT with pleckstrin-like domain
MRTALKPNEKVLLIIRHHWLKLAMPFFIWILVAVICAIFLSVSTAFLIILITALYPLAAYFIWVHNIWAVTNIRVIDEGGVFTRHAKESPLEKINNIEYSQSFWGRIFGFGNVDIKTAAELGETNYEMIHHPKLLKDTITHAQEEYKKTQLNNQTAQLAKSFAENTAVYNRQPSRQMIADELQKLFDLLQRGAITQGEYDSQKGKLLSNS